MKVGSFFFDGFSRLVGYFVFFFVPLLLFCAGFAAGGCEMGLDLVGKIDGVNIYLGFLVSFFYLWFLYFCVLLDREELFTDKFAEILIFYFF